MTIEKQPKASIVVVNWDGERFLNECLTSVYNQTYQDFEIIFVDNGSTDNSIALVEKNFPGVRIIKNDKNEGSARGINIGMLAAKGEYVVLLNNDTHVFKDWLEILIKTAEENPQAAVVGSLNLNYGTDICQSWGNRINFINNFVFFNEYLGRGKKSSHPMFKENKKVDYVLGCSMLIKREVIKELGLIDEVYFAYHEELDWQYRMGLKGHQIITSPAKLWHYGGQSSKESWHKIYLVQKSKLTFIRLRMSPTLKYWNLVFSQPVHFLFMLGNAAIKNNFKANLKGIYHAIKWNLENKELKSQIPTLEDST